MIRLVNEQQVKASLARHRATPEVSTAAYVHRLMAELGDSIASRRKLYFDTRYWVNLRDAAMGRPTHQDHPEILELVRGLVTAGAVVCPVSDAAWVELTKQSDPETLRATAELIDELSLGIALRHEKERIEYEIEQLLVDPEAKESLATRKNRVWVKAGYVYGIRVPVSKELSPAQNRVLQKSMVDYRWQLTYREIAAQRSLVRRSDPWEASAARITESMRKYDHEVRSIQQAFAAESAGVLVVFKDTMREVTLRNFRMKTGDRAPVPQDQAEKAGQSMLTALVNAFRLRPKQMAQHIPTLYAYAMCHAAVRMDKKRKFSGHDLLDMHHASAGIPYHDAVFTEIPLRALVTAGNVALDKTFSCSVLAKERDVLTYLRAL
uniref:Uncharacterized protein n=1 Tax=mine drainage metagenome TaxID=410659 RepID=E6PQ77_9ZZZZ